MTNERFTSVWNAIEDTPEQAAEMRLRSSLLSALQDEIARSGLASGQIAKRLNIARPRVADLQRGRINQFDLPSLLAMARTMGLTAEPSITVMTPAP